jgi:hypothetical protein
MGKPVCYYITDIYVYSFYQRKDYFMILVGELNEGKALHSLRSIQSFPL